MDTIFTPIITKRLGSSDYLKRHSAAFEQILLLAKTDFDLVNSIIQCLRQYPYVSELVFARTQNSIFEAQGVIRASVNEALRLREIRNKCITEQDGSIARELESILLPTIDNHQLLEVLIKVDLNSIYNEFQNVPPVVIPTESQEEEEPLVKVDEPMIVHVKGGYDPTREKLRIWCNNNLERTCRLTKFFTYLLTERKLGDLITTNEIMQAMMPGKVSSNQISYVTNLVSLSRAQLAFASEEIGIKFELKTCYGSGYILSSNREQ